LTKSVHVCTITTLQIRRILDHRLVEPSWDWGCIERRHPPHPANLKVQIDHNVFLYYLLYGVKLRFDKSFWKKWYVSQLFRHHSLFLNFIVWCDGP
jgi:hypothetical protein